MGLRRGERNDRGGHALTSRGIKNRTIGLIENGSWAPMAAKVMRSLFERSKKLLFAETTVTIRSALNEQSENAVKALAGELNA